MERGNIRNILDFEQDFPNTKVIKLEENYRSTKNILNVANSIVKNNVGRKSKELWTGNADGNKVVTYTSMNEKDEARFVVSKIKKYIEDGKKNNEFAVLYRTNAQSRALEEEFLNASIPYKIYGGTNFYNRKEIKDIIAYLRLLVNSSDDVSFARIINEPKRGIGKTTIDKLIDYAEKNRTSAYNAIDYAESAGISKSTVNKLFTFKTVMVDLRNLRDSITVKELIEETLNKTGYLQALQNEGTSDADGRIENLQELLSVAIEFENTEVLDEEGNLEPKNLKTFLNNIALVSDIDNVDEDNAITLMTLHSAKGLEFPIVFMTGMEEGIFPSFRSMDSPDRLEEERRLCYVGVTRAREELFLTNANARFIYGRTNYNLPSRFLEEIPEDNKLKYL
jgi:DNA helicase-2/ATP-dependent DNA helicase PcrA